MKNQKKKIILLIILSFLSVLVFAALALWLIRDNQANSMRFFAHNISDASYDCEDKIDNQFNDRLVSKNFDNLSSRHESKKRQYLIFYRITTRQLHDDYYTYTDRLAKCVVWERLGYVSEFQILDL